MNKSYFKKLSLTLLAPALLAPVATIISCSSVKSDLQLATDRVVQFLNDNILNYGIWLNDVNGYHPNLAILEDKLRPGINLGFKTTLELLNYDTDKGQLTLRVQLKRSEKEVNDFKITLNGLRTKKQEVVEQKIKKELGIHISQDIFNRIINSKDPSAIIPDKLNEDVLLSYINWGRDSKYYSTNIWDSELSPEDIGVTPEFKDIQLERIHGIETGHIEFKVRLSKDGVWTNWTKHIVHGFQDHMRELWRNIDYYIQMFDAYLKGSGDPNKKPSEIKNKEELEEMYIIPINEGGWVEINEIVEGSANDKEGSIVLNLKFKIFNAANGQITVIKNVPIKFYGFKATG